MACKELYTEKPLASDPDGKTVFLSANRNNHPPLVHYFPELKHPETNSVWEDLGISKEEYQQILPSFLDGFDNPEEAELAKYLLNNGIYLQTFSDPDYHPRAQATYTDLLVYCIVEQKEYDADKAVFVPRNALRELNEYKERKYSFSFVFRICQQLAQKHARIKIIPWMKQLLEFANGRQLAKEILDENNEMELTIDDIPEPDQPSFLLN